MDYTQAVEYLHDVISRKNLKHPLNILIDILKYFSSPQEKLKIIHVAGTNGKGSTCAMLSDILMEAGYTVGTFTSPHLAKFNERFSIGGINISDSEFASLLGRVICACEKYFGSKDEKLSFFELLTIMAFIYFKESNVDYAVIETGMGGRLDSTNIITSPYLSVITYIGYDHMNILGNTLNSIAGEKAGIIKKNCPVVLYLNTDEVYNVIKDTAAELDSKLYYEKDIKVNISHADLNGTVFSVKSDYFSYDDITLAMFGKYQVNNTVGVLLAVRALNDIGITITERDVRAAFKKVKWPCRMEIIRENPLILLDGAHNIDGAVAFAETMSFFSGKRIILVVGILRDKQYQGIMEHLSKHASVIIATEPESSRALEADALASEAVDKEIMVIKNCYEAIDKAVLIASKDDVVCVTGSLYLVGALRSYLRRKSDAEF